MGVDKFNIEDVLLLVNIGADEDAAIGIFSEVGVDDLRSVQVATHALSFLLYSDGVLLSCLQLSFLVGKCGLHSILALLHCMLRVAPSTHVQPTIVLSIFIVKYNQEAFGTAVLGGVNSYIHIGGCELLVEYTGYVGCRGVRLSERSVAKCPIATPHGPFARQQVLHLEGRVASRDAEIGECSTGGPSAQTDTALCGVERRNVVLLALPDILSTYIIAKHSLNIVGGCSVTHR